MPDPTILWLTDNSRYTEGLDRCLMARFLGYHWGPTGYGIRVKAESLPLATGKYLHAGEEHIDRWVMDHDQLPPETVVREAITIAVDAYERIVELRGLRQLADGERLEEVIREQKTLIEGLIWAYVLKMLPWLHEQCRIIGVEREEELVLGCTCGLGDRIGTFADHEARACEGLGWQSKPDLLTDYRARPGVLAYWEKKTVGMTGERWETEWETKIQFVTGAKNAEARLGTPIQEAWVIGHVKGKREGSEYDSFTRRRTGPQIQQSVLCYGYRRPGNPPLEPPDWQAAYEWKDAEGKTRRLGKDYRKTGIWELAQDEPALGQPGAPSVSEFWTKWMPATKLAEVLQVIGPLEIKAVLADQLLEEAVHHERWWQGVVWELYEVLTTQAGNDWTSPIYQAALRRLLPRSWSCRRFGKRYQCQFVPVCFQQEGWQDPVGSGKFVERRPHHAAELAQVRARGLEPEDGWAEDVEEGED